MKQELFSWVLTFIVLFLSFQEIKLAYLYVKLITNQPKIIKVERTGYYTVHGQAAFYVLPLDGSIKVHWKVKTTILTQFVPFFLGQTFSVMPCESECVLRSPVSFVLSGTMIFLLIQFGIV
jgi:hypothetical protein